MELRKIRANEIQVLQDFLYEAIFIPEGVEPPAREIIELPELKLYYENFGAGTADNCIVADDGGKLIGAVWTRIMNDYGHVDDDTPSFAISLYKEYRGLHYSKRKVISKRLSLYRKQIMRFGCMRRLDSRPWARMKKNILWCVNYESNQLF